ncbi:hypothetical protein L6R52_31385 [Myxococcota bacterium]|nr:hypothetical protein [Myxococcota bacterium]
MATETPNAKALPPRDKRIVKHIRAMAEAGTDIEAFAKALQGMRDDASLTTAQRDAIFKTLAQDAAQAYYVMVTGKPIELEKLGEPQG